MTPDRVAEAPDAAPLLVCAVCLAGDTLAPDDQAWFCSADHTPSIQRLAAALNLAIQGELYVSAHDHWYIDDAVAIAPAVMEGEGWRVEPEVPGVFLGERFKVNGVEFWLDPNGETGTVPIPAATHDAEMAEWDDEIDE